MLFSRFISNLSAQVRRRIRLSLGSLHIPRRVASLCMLQEYGFVLLSC